MAVVRFCTEDKVGEGAVGLLDVSVQRTGPPFVRADAQVITTFLFISSSVSTRQYFVQVPSHHLYHHHAAQSVSGE